MSEIEFEKQPVKNQSVERLFTIIEAMAKSNTPNRLQDLAASVKLSPSTVLRFLNTLEGLGYVYQDPLSLRYHLTLKLTHMGNLIVSQISIRDIARPFLMKLSDLSDETVCLAEEQNEHAVYLDVVDTHDYNLRFIQKPGVRAPMHCTGIGKLLLLNKSPSELQEYLEAHKQECHTCNTITTNSMLVKELEKIREQGYAIDNEEYADGIRSIAAPVRDYSGKIIYGISVAGPSSRLKNDNIEKIIPIIIETANQISQILGTT